MALPHHNTEVVSCRLTGQGGRSSFGSLPKSWRLPQRCALRATLTLSGVVETGRPPFPSPGTCRSKASVGTFPAEFPFELSQRAEVMKDQRSASCRGVNALSQRPEPHVPISKLAHRIDDVSERPAKAIQSPHHKGAPFTEVIEYLIELRPAIQDAGRLVRENP